jgi:hypothetical protein
MKCWIDLYAAHQQARALSTSGWSGELRNRLIALSKAGYCDPIIAGRFTYTTEGSLVQWSIRSEGKSTSVALDNLPDLKVADLSLMALVSRKHHLHQFTVMVEGFRSDDSPWALAVHLPDDRRTLQNPMGDRQGLGAGGHAALHCHVGPDLDLAPKVRVPLPPLGPVAVLDWVISQIVPSSPFEPAPWADVETTLNRATQ